MDVRGKMWRAIKKMYEGSKSMVLLDGKKSEGFNVEQGVAQGCSIDIIHRTGLETFHVSA